MLLSFKHFSILTIINLNYVSNQSDRFLCKPTQIFQRLPRFTKKDGSTKIFVGNISEDTENSDLRSLFEVYGTVEEADICGGYGFVVGGPKNINI